MSENKTTILRKLSCSSKKFLKAEGPSEDSKKNVGITPASNDLDDYSTVPFRTTYILLACIGSLPVSWKIPHQPSLHPLRSTLLIGILSLTIVVLTPIYAMHPHKNRFIYEEISIDDRLLIIQFLILYLYGFAVPAFWLDGHAVKKTYDALLKITRSYREITGQRFTVLRNLEKILNVAAFAIPPIFFFPCKDSMPALKFDYYTFPAFFILSVTLVLLFTLWAGLYSSLEHVAAKVNVHFAMDLKKKQINSTRIQVYRKMRIEMRSLLDATGRFVTPVVIFNIFLASSVVLIYQTVRFLSKGLIAAGVLHLSIAFLQAAAIFFLAYLANVATDQIIHLNSCVLAKEALTSLGDVQREVVGIYLSDNVRAPVPTFNGFLSADKGLVTSVLATIATNLVMVFQVTANIKQNN